MRRKIKKLIAFHLVMGLLLLGGCASSGAKYTAEKPNQIDPEFRPPGYAFQRKDSKHLLVLVHGLTGNGVQTWTSPSGTYWPKLIEQEKTLREFDVYVYQYGTRFFGDCMPVTDIANHLRLRLVDAGAFKKYSEVFFLAHSMGGIVVRQFLIRHPNLAKQVPMVLFYATPTGGAEAANTGSVLSTCIQVEDLRKLDGNTYLQSLHSNWVSQGLSRSIESHCAFETVGTTVSRLSASYLCTNDPDAIETDHSNTVKPESASAKPHLVLRTAIREYLDSRAFPRDESGNLYVDCRPGMMPTRVPPDGSIFVWAVSDTMPEVDGVLEEYFGQPGSEWNVGKMAHRCEVTNYTTHVLFNVQMDWRVTITEAIQSPKNPNLFGSGKVTLDRGWRITVPKIDAGPDKRFIFYIYNCCGKNFVQVRAPSKASVELAGMSKDVPVKHPGLNLAIWSNAR